MMANCSAEILISISALQRRHEFPAAQLEPFDSGLSLFAGSRQLEKREPA